MILSVLNAVGNRLAAVTAVTSLVSSRLYAVQAPLNATVPHLVFFLSSGGDTNDWPRDGLDVLVTVRAVSTSGAGALGIADAARTALHEAALTMADPWAAWRCQHTQAFAFAEIEDRATFYYAGGLYRIRAAGS